MYNIYNCNNIHEFTHVHLTSCGVVRSFYTLVRMSRVLYYVTEKKNLILIATIKVHSTVHSNIFFCSRKNCERLQNTIIKIS